MSVPAKQLLLKTVIPSGLPGPEHFDVVDFECPLAAAEGEVTFRILVMSADPFLRGWVKGRPGTVEVGQRMMGFVAGKVIASKSAKWTEGDLFGGMTGLATVSTLPEEKYKGFWKLNGVLTEENISYGVGVLGMPGSTAYGGFTDVLAPNKGETIFVSAAAGAVGGLVGQIAKKAYNCTVIGSAGGPEKCEFVKSTLGFDHCIDYRTVSTREELAAAIKAVAPEGIDMYFENVGTIHMEAAMDTLRPHGRVAVCGAISGYNEEVAPRVSIDHTKMIYTFQRISGFVCQPWLSGQKGSFIKDMGAWVKDLPLHVEETFFDGIDQWPVAFQALFKGSNRGKVVVRTPE